MENAEIESGTGIKDMSFDAPQRGQPESASVGRTGFHAGSGTHLTRSGKQIRCISYTDWVVCTGIRIAYYQSPPASVSFLFTWLREELSSSELNCWNVD